MAYGTDAPDLDRALEENQSAVSWEAILAGSVATVALTFVTLSIAAGFGLKVSPRWPTGLSTDDFTPAVGATFVAAQVVASMFGGYLAGRLRTKWLHVHDHETHFRDTAHGLLAWAGSVVGLLALGALLSPAAPALPAAPLSAEATLRAARVAAQLSFFVGIGALTSAFSASVAAAIGGMRRDEMHKLYRTK